jgi:mycothiol system anti-sigma-R factor
MITCKDCARALYPYLDRELSEEDVVQVRQHLEDCGGCLHLFQFQASLSRLVQVRCQEQTAPESLRAQVIARLTQERDRRPKRKQP